LGPGYYNHDEAIKTTQTKSRAAVIKESNGYKRPVEPTPEAGDAHLSAFGSGLKKVDFGRKYEFKADSNPCPGQYETDNKITKPASFSAKIVQPTSTYRRPVENSPEPGQYSAHLDSFGSKAKSF